MVDASVEEESVPEGTGAVIVRPLEWVMVLDIVPAESANGPDQVHQPDFGMMLQEYIAQTLRPTVIVKNPYAKDNNRSSKQ